MKVSKKLKLPNYSCTVEIIVSDEINSIVNNIYSKNKIDERFTDAVEGILITLDISTYYLILNTKYLTHNTIAHEVYHASRKVTEDREIQDEESQAWLAGYIAAEVYKFIEKKKFIVTHGRY